MKTGYLYLETHTEHPGKVRFLVTGTMPDTPGGYPGARTRYIARFNDVEAAQMHVQNRLHRVLVDIETHMYRVGLPEAMAVVESDDLKHERVWIDPLLDEEELGRMMHLAEVHRRKKHRSDRIWQGVGYFALVFLALRALGLF